MTLRRLYTSAALAVLPSVESILAGIQALLNKLDALTDTIERNLEEQVVVLAKNAERRRLALEAANARFDAKDEARMAVITSRQEKLGVAAQARDAVADFLDNL